MIRSVPLSSLCGEVALQQPSRRSRTRMRIPSRTSNKRLPSRRCWIQMKAHTGSHSVIDNRTSITALMNPTKKPWTRIPEQDSFSNPSDRLLGHTSSLVLHEIRKSDKLKFMGHVKRISSHTTHRYQPQSFEIVCLLTCSTLHTSFGDF